MSTTAFFDIEAAFQTTLNGISGKPTIDWEGFKPYIPTLGTRYWRTTNIPTTTEQITTGALRQHKGFYQVDVFCPLGKGVKQAMNDMDLIAGTFDTTTSLNSNNTKVQILGVSRTRVLQDDSWLVGSVKINYICYSY